MQDQRAPILKPAIFHNHNIDLLVRPFTTFIQNNHFLFTEFVFLSPSTYPTAALDHKVHHRAGGHTHLSVSHNSLVSTLPCTHYSAPSPEVLQAVLRTLPLFASSLHFPQLPSLSISHHCPICLQSTGTLLITCNSSAAHQAITPLPA